MVSTTHSTHTHLVLVGVKYKAVSNNVLSNDEVYMSVMCLDYVFGWQF